MFENGQFNPLRLFIKKKRKEKVVAFEEIYLNSDGPKLFIATRSKFDTIERTNTWKRYRF